MPYTCVMVGLILALPESTTITYVSALRGDLLVPFNMTVFDDLAGLHSEPRTVTLKGYGSTPKFEQSCLDDMITTVRSDHVGTP